MYESMKYIVLKRYLLQLEGISDNDICKLDLPNGIPIVYRFPPCLLFLEINLFF